MVLVPIVESVHCVAWLPPLPNGWACGDPVVWPKIVVVQPCEFGRHDLDVDRETVSLGVITCHGQEFPFGDG